MRHKKVPFNLKKTVDSKHGCLCGYDADQAGDLAAAMLQAKTPAVRRMRPDSDDWNEILQRQKNKSEPDTEPKQ